MKSLILEQNGAMEIKDIPIPNINSKQALVKMLACGLCGTDIKLIHSCFKGVPASSYPLILGHEGVGEVVKVGADVRGYKEGDRVIVPFLSTEDPQYEGLGSAWGALSEYAIVDDALAYEDGQAPECAYGQTVLDSSLDPVDAVMLVTFREVLSSIHYFGIRPENSVVVFGCGPVGLTFIKFLHLMGVQNIVAVAITDEKLGFAKEKGAQYTVNNKTQDVTAAVRELFPNGVDYVLDAVGKDSVVNQGMGLLADRGAVLCYGVPAEEEITIDFSKAPYNWRVVYQQMPLKQEESDVHEQIMSWIQDGSLVLKDFISDYYAFENSVQAYKDLETRKISKKAIITF